MVRTLAGTQHSRTAQRRAPRGRTEAMPPAAAMTRTAYVLLADARQRARVDAALLRCVDRVVQLDAIEALPDRAADGEHDCLIVSAEAAEPDVVKTIGALRDRGNTIAVIALGSHAAFRQAIDIARFDGTDVLESPVSDRELRQAVRRMCRPRPRNPEAAGRAREPQGG